MVLGIAMQGVGQTLNVPKFSKIIEVTTPGVNLRKEPDTSSPRLVGWFLGDKTILQRGGVITDEANFRLQFAWEGEDGRKGKLARAKYLLVVDETDEWYHALPLINNLELSQASHLLVYVSKKVCKVRSPKQLSAGYFENYHAFTSGKYKGYCCFSDYLESTFYQSLFLGRIENGVGFGWVIGNDAFEETKQNPSSFEGQDPQKIEIVVAEKVTFYDNHGEAFDEGDGIHKYMFFPGEYKGELISH